MNYFSYKVTYEQYTGERRTENGERRTENGEWRMENKTTENGEQKRGRRKSNATGETGYGEKITEVWGRKSVVNLHNNSK